MQLQNYFEEFRANTIGNNQVFETYYGNVKMVYADWTASGRMYGPIESKIINKFGPFVGNTHSLSSETGMLMTQAYNIAHQRIKEHVKADCNDVIITAGSGMTCVINKLQRILGLKISEKLWPFVNIPEELKPVVFVTHMEHHSNQTSWLETIADVEIISPDRNGLIDVNNLDILLKKYHDRKLKIGSFTACSNVTGIQTPYHKMAKIMHQHNGVCFVDFAASAPYIHLDMHPDDPEEKLDAIFFSPHKFLGGPATSGVLVFDSRLYANNVPDNSGGGIVDWTNPWGEHKYSSDIEIREDGGTPGFLQAIRTALCLRLKEDMGVENMLKREKELMNILFSELDSVEGLHILAENIRDRLGILSFYVDNIHYNLLVKILNDRFGIQSRGGCSCAGTYGHYLFNIDKGTSYKITNFINSGDLSQKPGWVRLSIHPIMTDQEVQFIADAVKQIVKNIKEWQDDYSYDASLNEFRNRHSPDQENIKEWFKL
ncbi:aminotransferase class V-fold PLP-dependent enzyme [Desulfosporosinus sp. BICA1-9]|uniref:aminotransferase class V-fold PLP-dependent enzyme n=1 Tax=Desulfosporosinus sp. BICA1-9 TaxID=1531958 RepID=UPI00054C43A9|nr:aminotransferase class V-fold PLP-dependent enzyme [Desulfosporosinus sp. BICA1-9]KJS47766.1 MAG: selenocysteine lyase [Peptococcaceae bacterium BRH_c23]KJS89045.1 MAG: selenocysteine lyase [Desulfosporosinus sp. BICA1-9]HBW36607.1 aminotransferase class V-fold PLP-dependent enzyme [Desulfosporosinus sp.]